MCSPIAPILSVAKAIAPFAGMAMSAAGIAAQDRAAREAQRARQKALTDTAARNLALEEEARSALIDSGDEFRPETFERGVGATTGRLANFYDDVSASYRAPPAIDVSARAPRVVQDAVREQIGAANAFNDNRNADLAALNALGSYLSNRISPRLNSSARSAQRAGNFMAGNSSLLGSALESANQLTHSPAAQYLRAGGKVLTAYGLSKPKERPKK